MMMICWNDQKIPIWAIFSDGDIEAIEEPEAAEEGLDTGNMDDSDLLDRLLRGRRIICRQKGCIHVDAAIPSND